MTTRSTSNENTETMKSSRGDSDLARFEEPSIEAISLCCEISAYAPDGDDRYRFNWDTPIHISYHDSDTLYMGGNFLFRSRNQGNEWQAISPDLTTYTRSLPDFRDGEPDRRSQFAL